MGDRVGERQAQIGIVKRPAERDQGGQASGDTGRANGDHQLVRGAKHDAVYAPDVVKSA